MVTPHLVSARLAQSAAPAQHLLGLLPAHERDALTLARIERFTYREVAIALGIPEEAAKRRIRSGLRRLKAEIARATPATP